MFSKTYQIPTILGVVATVVLQTQASIALDSDKIANIAKSVTVLIETPGSPGSGVLIAKQVNRRGHMYFVLTARHVIDSIQPGEEAVVVTFEGDEHLVNTGRMHIVPDIDLAIIEFISTKNYQLAQIGTSEVLQSGTKVYVAGYPLPTKTINSQDFQFSPGTITAATSESLQDGYSLVYNSYTLPGMSGGPVLDEKGILIGVHGRADTETQATDNPNIFIKTGLNLGIPISSLVKLSAKLNLKLPIPESASIRRPTVIRTSPASSGSPVCAGNTCK